MEYAFREVTLPSGAILKIQPAPFADAKALYQALLEELKAIDMPRQMDVANLVKTALSSAFSSKKVEAALWQCFRSCLYSSEKGELKIDKDTFNPIDSRQDYVQVCMEVAHENVGPFLKGLYVMWETVLSTIGGDQK